MLLKLDNYNLGVKVVSLALDETALRQLAFDNLPSIHIENDYLVFYPEKVKLKISKENIEKIKNCDNYDVFTISDAGQVYLYYNNESSDNVILVTNKCNSNCIMCPTPESVRKTENETNIDVILQAIKHMPDDAEHITITGGEPFLAGEDIFKIFSALKYKMYRTRFLLLTNGRALSYKPFFEKFKETVPNNTLVGIPLHGYDAETHDYITQSKGGFWQTFYGIKNLFSYNQSVEIRMVVSKLNYKYIDKISDLIIEEFPSVETVKIMGLEMTGNAYKNRENVWLSYPEAFQYSKNAINKLINRGIDVQLYNFPLCAVDKEYHKICARSITDYKVRYGSVCNECVLKDACGGVFAGTLKLSETDMKPWR